MLRIEGSGASQLVQLIKELGHNTDVTIELGTVTANPPALKIKLDNMNVELEKDDLIVAQSLTKHTRTVNLKNTGKTSIDASSLTKFLPDFVFAGQGTLTFNGAKIADSDFVAEKTELEFADELKEGDRVIVAGIHDGQTYVVLDRAVTY
ncbi:DUF2577 family protein [Paenibacillus xanthanilyticus]|uniref:DUF2577 family protein n=1 Tax=Paenibacillus xanthanilyticus TaxID=1783531 RepID=A0ABV8K6R7_9BACL